MRRRETPPDRAHVDKVMEWHRSLTDQKKQIRDELDRLIREGTVSDDNQFYFERVVATFVEGISGAQYHGHLGRVEFGNPSLFAEALLRVTRDVLAAYHDRMMGRQILDTDLEAKPWQDARPSDLENVPAFFERINAEIRDPRLSFFPTEAYTHHVIDVPGSALDAVRMDCALPQHDMEGAHELQFTFQSQGSEYLAQSVRFGMHAPDKAIIYAIQSPPTDGYTMKRIEAEEQKIRALTEYFAKREEDMPVKVDEQFLQEHAGMTYGPLCERYEESLSQNDIDNLESLLMYRGRQEQRELARARMEREREFHRGLSRELRPSGNDPRRKVAATGFIPLLTTIGLMHHQGIRTIEIPLVMPFRAHTDNPQLDKRIQSNKKHLVSALIRELEGCSARISDDTLFIDLEDELQADRPMMQHILEKTRIEPLEITE